jgi:hypothetical protein
MQHNQHNRLLTFIDSSIFLDIKIKILIIVFIYKRLVSCEVTLDAADIVIIIS